MTTPDSSSPYNLAGPAQAGGWKRTLLRAALDRSPSSWLVTRRPRANKAIALTFDDGPDALTPQYLACLAEMDVTATFFLVGENVAARPDDVRAIVAAGHEVAGHGFTHNPFPSLDRTTLYDELFRTEGLFPRGRRVRPLVRPPQGRISARSLALTALAGFNTVLWSLDSDDCRTSDPAAIAARLAPHRVRDGENVLLHEGQSWTLAALQLFVPPLKQAGFTFLTISDLLSRT